MKKIYICALATLTLWGASSCKKLNDFGTTNVDPKAVNTPIPAALFANSLNGLAGYVTTNQYAIGPGSYTQYFSETQYPSVSLYVLPQNDFAPAYNGTLYDLQNVINLNQSKNSVAAARILQSYIYWEITDSFGDVPYSQALQGIKAINPVYDKQEDIYKGILNTLTSAMASMDNGSIPGDISTFGGDAASWKRFANSLKLLVALQASKAPDNDFAKTAFAQAASDPAGLITDVSQNFSMAFPGGTSNYNSPWYNLYNGRTDWAESKTMTDMTGSLNDGRTVPFGGSFTDPLQVKGGTQTSNIGLPPGYDRAKTIAFTSANPSWALILRADYRTLSGTTVITSAAEVLLALAEGANIGWIPNTDMVSNYQKGITASFAQWGLDAPAASYFTQSGVAITAGGNNAKNIATQQWIAGYPDGHQGWNIWRKTGFPVLAPAPEAKNPSGQIVRRFVYATNEYTTNEKNVRAAVAREVGPNAGTDSQDNHVWWDPINP